MDGLPLGIREGELPCKLRHGFMMRCKKPGHFICTRKKSLDTIRSSRLLEGLVVKEREREREREYAGCGLRIQPGPRKRLVPPAPGTPQSS